MAIGTDCEINKSTLDTFGGTEDKNVPTSPDPETVREQVIEDYLHDLRTPLVALRGYAKMLQEERVGPLNPVQKNYIQIVVENSQRLVRVLNDLSQISAIDPMIFENVDVRDLFNQLLKSWAQRHVGRSISIEEISDLTRPRVWGNSQQLAQALDEIVARVIEASPANAEVRVFLSPMGDRVHVRISSAALVEGSALVGGENGRPPTSSTRSSLDRVGGLSAAEAVIVLHGGYFVRGSEPPDDATIYLVLPAYTGASKEKECL